MVRTAWAICWLLGAFVGGCGDDSPPASEGKGAAIAGRTGRGGTAGAGGAGTGGGTAGGGSAGRSFFSTGGSMAGGPAAAGQGGHAGAGPCEGYVTITSVGDLSTFAGRQCETFDGSIYFYGYDSPNLDFLAQSPLRTITGSLGFSQTDLVNLAGLAGLRSIGRTFYVDQNAMLQNLDGLESLEQIGADPTNDGLLVQGNPVLTSIAALSNTKLTGKVTVMSNDAITSLSALGHLKQSAAVWLSGQAVTEVDLGELEECQECTISNLPKLERLDLGSLRRAETVRVAQDYRLGTLALPLLETVEKNFTVIINDELTSLGTLEKLTSVGMMQIAENPKLPQCFVDALGARLMACRTRCGGNDKAAPCP